VSDLKRYLRQQRELYGDSLPLPSLEGIRSPAGKAVRGGRQEQARRSPDPARFPEAGTLEEFRGMIDGCMKCPLGETRTNFVFGAGNPEADIVLIGEAPGADEDLRGEPFVGRAGQLLNEILKAIELRREDVYICNILKCRPPGNRDPLAAEVAQCEPYLHHQLRMIKPLLMLALGRIAAQTLLRSSDTLTVLRRKTHSYQGIPLMVTYHPAALLRNAEWKRPTWEDVKKFKAMYDGLRSSGTRQG
jgi:DNA polymerase